MSVKYRCFIQPGPSWYFGWTFLGKKGQNRYYYAPHAVWSSNERSNLVIVRTRERETSERFATVPIPKKIWAAFCAAKLGA